MSLREEIFSTKVPAGSIAIWWLGQASFIFKSPGGKVVALDPYLTNSCKALGEEVGFKFDRQFPPPLTPEELGGIDCYLLTHSHQDHLDPETLTGYRAAGGAGPYFAPPETIEKLQALGVPGDQLIMSWPNKVIKIGDVTLRTAFAIPFGPDDLTHVGYVVSMENGPTVYFTGDTAYHELLGIAVEPYKPEVLVAVINGAFRNLSPAEAARLARQLNVKVAIPCHYDLFFDNCQPPQMLLTNLKIEGLGDRYRELRHGVAYLYPETSIRS